MFRNLCTGVSRITVRFGSGFGTRSMSTSSSRSVDQLLSGKNDDHGGVIVEMSTEPVDAVVYGSLLRASILHWRQEGKKGVWIKVPIELVSLVEPAVKEGFYFHHAEPKYLMLVYWIPETPSTIPVNATHRVGIGGFVMNEKKEVLVVQEKNGILRGTGVWKFPTGVVEEGEDICDAAVREVKEETGVSNKILILVRLNFAITLLVWKHPSMVFVTTEFWLLQIDTKFVEILAFRQSHKSFFEKSDLFFVCLLQPLSFNIQPQESEIEAAQWMPFEEYTAQQFVQKNEVLKYISDVCLSKREGKYSGFSPVPTSGSFSTTESYMYLNRHCLNSP
ncbi:nudix hydrolase 2 isoform X2 [Rhododendron vialii]|uniref:nudix hydrolase 2 isoform X2 n=1 Tax=Rhododendron vialii TaxID=182163 RepID=UPI00265D9A6D|nr:nudix hydrolase 2 isoform X2 [Rhododendron vialii]